MDIFLFDPFVFSTGFFSLGFVVLLFLFLLFSFSLFTSFFLNTKNIRIFQRKCKFLLCNITKSYFRSLSTEWNNKTTTKKNGFSIDSITRLWFIERASRRNFILNRAFWRFLQISWWILLFIIYRYFFLKVHRFHNFTTASFVILRKISIRNVIFREFIHFIVSFKYRFQYCQLP